MDEKWVLSIYIGSRTFDFGPYDSMKETLEACYGILSSTQIPNEGVGNIIDDRFVKRLSATFKVNQKTFTWINPEYVEAVDISRVD